MEIKEGQTSNVLLGIGIMIFAALTLFGSVCLFIVIPDILQSFKDNGTTVLIDDYCRWYGGAVILFSAGIGIGYAGTKCFVSESEK